MFSELFSGLLNTCEHVSNFQLFKQLFFYEFIQFCLICLQLKKTSFFFVTTQNNISLPKEGGRGVRGLDDIGIIAR